MKKCLLLLIALCALALPALASASDNSMRVTGTATVSVAPDRAALDIGFTAQETESGEAQRKMAEGIEKIKAAVLSMGVAEEDIKTSYLSFNPVYDYQGDAPQISGYRAEHMLSVSVAEITTIGDVLDAALSAGANQVGGVSYSASNEKLKYLEALGKAFEEASAKADALAITAGVWLGQISQVNELSSYAPYNRAGGALYSAADMAASSIGQSLMTGEIEITASVELVYSIR